MADDLAVKVNIVIPAGAKARAIGRDSEYPADPYYVVRVLEGELVSGKTYLLVEVEYAEVISEDEENCPHEGTPCIHCGGGGVIAEDEEVSTRKKLDEEDVAE